MRFSLYRSALFGGTLSSVLPTYLFLIRPPLNSHFIGWTVTSGGKLTMFGIAFGSLFTLGFAAYGGVVIYGCCWAYERFVRVRLHENVSIEGRSSQV